jgi:hypothetical protein
MHISSYTTTDGAIHDSNIIPFNDDKVQPASFEDDKEGIDMIFMLNETVTFKDG